MQYKHECQILKSDYLLTYLRKEITESRDAIASKNWDRVNFKTIPDFEIWPRCDGEIEEKPNQTEWIAFDFTVHTEALILL